MRFYQPVGVIPQNNDYGNVNVNVNDPESRFLINSKTNNQLTRTNNENNFANVTENLKSAVIEKRNESTNNFDLNKTTTLENILKFKSDSKYFKSYLDSQQTDSNNIDSENGNNGVIFIEALNFTDESLSQVRAE